MWLNRLILWVVPQECSWIAFVSGLWLLTKGCMAHQRGGTESTLEIGTRNRFSARPSNLLFPKLSWATFQMTQWKLWEEAKFFVCSSRYRLADKFFSGCLMRFEKQAAFILSRGITEGIMRRHISSAWKLYSPCCIEFLLKNCLRKLNFTHLVNFPSDNRL